MTTHATKVRRIDRIGRLVVVDEGAPQTPANSGPGIVAAHPTSEGYLRARARIARDGLLEYGDGRSTWNEYRSRDELAKAAPSFALVLVTDDHPDEFVSPDNAKDLFVGMLGQDLTVEDGPDGRAYLVATITVADAAAIEKVKGGKVELSIGFATRVVDAPGVFDGEAFAYLQTELEGNHTAIVDAGRAGPIAKIPTSDVRAALRGAAVGTRRIDQAGAAAPTARRADMETTPIEIQGVTYNVEAPVAAYITALQQQIAAGTPAAEGEGAAPAAAAPAAAAPGAAPAAGAPAVVPGQTAVGTGLVVPQRSADTATIEAARDAAEAREAQARADADARIDARVELVATARTIVGDSITTGMSDSDIHRAVAKAVFPKLAAKLDAIKADEKTKRLSAGDAGYLRALYDQAVAHAGAARADIGSYLERARNSHTDGAGDDLSDIHQSADELAARRDGRKPTTAAAAK